MTNFGHDFDNSNGNINGNPRCINTSRSSSSSCSCSSTTTTVYTEPGVSKNPLALQEDLHAIAQEYNNILGPMNMQIARFIERLLHDGMAANVILDALQETAWARRPSPQYFRAICARYYDRGILTMGALLHDRDEWENKRKPWWNVDDPELPF